VYPSSSFGKLRKHALMKQTIIDNRNAAIMIVTLDKLKPVFLESA
jgi:hypothetical protein